MSDTNALMAALEKRAGARLDRDLLELSKRVTDLIPSDAGPELFAPAATKGRTLFFHLKYERRPGSDCISSSSVMDALRADMLPAYVEQEVRNFMQKVDSMGPQEPDEE